MKKVPVSERALIQRLNRVLKDDDLVVKKCRVDSRAYYDLGDYYVVNFNRNFIVERNLDLTDLQKMGRTNEVLAEWEEAVKEEK